MLIFTEKSHAVVIAESIKFDKLPEQSHYLTHGMLYPFQSSKSITMHLSIQLAHF